jgi:hypothetical protein
MQIGSERQIIRASSCVFVVAIYWPREHAPRMLLTITQKLLLFVPQLSAKTSSAIRIVLFMACFS